MAFGVFLHRQDSIYDNVPAEQYQFPSQYLRRAQASEGDWIIYYEPRKAVGSRGYFAVAKVQKIVPDPAHRSMYLAIIEPGTYLPFSAPVPFSGPEGLIERGLLNEAGAISGRAQSAVRPLSVQDFNRIVDLGLGEGGEILDRLNGPLNDDILRDERSFFDHEPRERMAYFGTRIIRDRIFRRVVLDAYDCRCALTGLKLINGGGRAEVEAAHIRPVEAHGPDIINNGLALSGTIHWMFDRGLVSLQDDLQILVSRYVNDRQSVDALLNKNGRANLPLRSSDRPHPQYLRWHRENCFKQ